MKADAADAAYKTLYLLHGLSDDHSIWMRRTSIERYASQYGIAVVMPGVGRSWYTDTAWGDAYLTFVAKELPDVCRGYFRGMSDKREDTLVGGLSMGGYGAVKAALTYPERFGACISLSGALDIVREAQVILRPEEWRGIFGFELQDASELRGSCHDLFALTRAHSEAGKAFPRFYLWCGTEDKLLPCNREYDALLNELGIEHQYEESAGNHSWPWWDLHIQSGLKALLG
jgi:putative tributyrin esterase